SSAIASVFMGTHMEAQIARLQALYRAKRDAMLQALAERMTPYARWIRPAGGFFVWLTLNEPGLAEPVVKRCREAGVLMREGSAFRADGANFGGIRLCFSQATTDEINDGIAVLAAVTAELASERASAGTLRS
ncbi:MAG: aminotransferase class I/II-fold pyridoxal phosphate-dependent enzyme, partial [Actinobacteria bacterium]|nr:aminotransferase class I/II-fold pyridoxal phosphate-dependent enzyme [Actinomycetota bacterium]